MESEDEVKLADRLWALLDDQGLCLRMGRRAHDVAVLRYAPDTIAEKTVQAYHAAMR